MLIARRRVARCRPPNAHVEHVDQRPSCRVTRTLRLTGHLLLHIDHHVIGRMSLRRPNQIPPGAPDAAAPFREVSIAALGAGGHPAR